MCDTNKTKFTKSGEKSHNHLHIGTANGNFQNQIKFFAELLTANLNHFKYLQ